MTLISHTHKFIYIKNVKVASTSVEMFFEPYTYKNPLEHVPEHRCSFKSDQYGVVGGRPGHLNPGPILPHDGLGKVVRYLDNNGYNHKNYFKFCVARNPFDRVVSQYLFDLRTPWPPEHMYRRHRAEFGFGRYIDQYHIPAADYRRRIVINNKIGMDYFIRFEDLHAGITEVCEKLNITDYDLTNLGFAHGEYRRDAATKEIMPRRHYREFYEEAPEAKAKVERLCKWELEYFGYEY